MTLAMEATATQQPTAKRDPRIVLGQRCELRSSGTGIRASLKRYGEIAFIGAIPGLPDGDWIGVRLDNPLGKNDGSHNGTRYFVCAPLHGAFVRPEKLNLDGEFPVLSTQHASIAHAKEAHRRKLEQKRQQEKANRADYLDRSADELVQEFWAQFMEGEDRVRKRLNQFIDQKRQPTPCDPAQAVKLDDLISDVHVMREASATAASLYLSPYDIRQTQMLITKLMDLIESTRTTFAPRKKFTFKARARRAAAPEHTGEDEQGDNNSKLTEKRVVEAHCANNSEKETSLYENLDELVYADRRNELICIDQTTFATEDGDGGGNRRRDLNFSRLENCVIFVSVETSAIRGVALKNCVVLAGPVWGSIWLENCQDCTFVVACRQLRVHLSAATSFHLRIGSHPIIEDCHQLRFGPYKLAFPGLEEQLEHCGLQRDNGLWTKVNDFKWHKAQQSPNWNLWDPKQSLPSIPSEIEALVRYV